MVTGSPDVARPSGGDPEEDIALAGIILAG